jgi:hypothetical protein
MRIENLVQPPYETSLMGVVRGVFDHYGIEASTPWLYGASGHAFVANIHEQLCPSGPYCWNGDGWAKLLANLGVARKDIGFFGPDSTPGQRSRVEEAVRTALDAGVLCSHLNMDNQLISGYDDTGFLNCRPWDDCPVTPGHLTFGTWDEFGDEIHVSFYRWEQVDPVDDRAAVRASLEYAVDLYENPRAHTEEPYGIGPDAYVNWIAAVEAGHGGDHGAWWNATVWSECRKMAASYFTEIARYFPETADAARSLAASYASLGESLLRAADKEMPAEEKAALLADAASAERDTVTRIPSLLDTL